MANIFRVWTTTLLIALLWMWWDIVVAETDTSNDEEAEFAKEMAETEREAQNLRGLMSEMKRIDELKDGMGNETIKKLKSDLSRYGSQGLESLRKWISHLNQTFGNKAAFKEKLKKANESVKEVRRTAMSVIPFLSRSPLVNSPMDTAGKDSSVGAEESPTRGDGNLEHCLDREPEDCAVDHHCFMEESSGLCLRNCSITHSEESCNSRPECFYDTGIKGSSVGCKNDCFLHDQTSGTLSKFVCGGCHTKKACDLMRRMAKNDAKGVDGRPFQQTCAWIVKDPPEFPTSRCINSAPNIDLNDQQKAALNKIKERVQNAEEFENGESEDGACIAPDTEHGTLDPQKELYTPGDVVEVVCEKGYEPSVVDNDMTCAVDGSGSFSPMISCVERLYGISDRESIVNRHGNLSTTPA